MTSNEFYTSTEVAAMLGVTRMTLHNWRKSKEPMGPPFIVIAPKIIRYRKSRTHAFIDAAERGVRFDRRQGHMSVAKRMALEERKLTKIKRAKNRGKKQARILTGKQKKRPDR